ncbi:hypothetical protein Tco_0998488, partial [Tanacetum coccineum]
DNKGVNTEVTDENEVDEALVKGLQLHTNNVEGVFSVVGDANKLLQRVDATFKSDEVESNYVAYGVKEVKSLSSKRNNVYNFISNDDDLFGGGTGGGKKEEEENDEYVLVAAIDARG